MGGGAVSPPDGQSPRGGLYAIDEIGTIASPIVRRFGMRRMRLFGSYARGEATPDSDPDFRADPGEPCDFMRYFGMISALEDAFGINIYVISVYLIVDNYLDKKFLKQNSNDEVLVMHSNRDISHI